MPGWDLRVLDADGKEVKRGTIGALSVYNRVTDFQQQDERILRRLRQLKQDDAETPATVARPRRASGPSAPA